MQFSFRPDDTVEPLQGDAEDGEVGARHGNLSQRQQPGHQHWVHLGTNTSGKLKQNKTKASTYRVIASYFLTIELYETTAFLYL